LCFGIDADDYTRDRLRLIEQVSYSDSKDYQKLIKAHGNQCQFEYVVFDEGYRGTFNFGNLTIYSYIGRLCMFRAFYYALATYLYRVDIDEADEHKFGTGGVLDDCFFLARGWYYHCVVSIDNIWAFSDTYRVPLILARTLVDKRYRNT